MFQKLAPQKWFREALYIVTGKQCQCTGTGHWSIRPSRKVAGCG